MGPWEARRLTRDNLLTVARQAVDIACDIIRTSAPGVLTPKGERDLVSDVDLTVEDRVRRFLADRTPDVGFLGEENGASPGPAMEQVWTLDPVDGTVNFVRGMPLCGVSLALVEGERPVVGVIGLPFLDAHYWAIDRGGAHLNGQDLQIRRSGPLAEAIVAVGDFAVGQDAEAKNRIRVEVVSRVAAAALRIRMLGSAAMDLAWLAEGKVDASITLSNNPWDMAAGVVVAREAGARVSDLDGSEYRMGSRAVLAARPDLIDQLVSIVQDATRTVTSRSIQPI
jgi:myo-inositol-1(or 4)-monophosphatase